MQWRQNILDSVSNYENIWLHLWIMIPIAESFLNNLHTKMARYPQVLRHTFPKNIPLHVIANFKTFNKAAELFINYPSNVPSKQQWAYDMQLSRSCFSACLCLSYHQ